MEASFNYKEINFKLRRNGWFGILLFVLIGLFCGFVGFIEGYLVPINNGLTPELGFVVPIFYGILGFSVATIWVYIFVNNFLLSKNHAEDIDKVKNLKWIITCCYFLPMVFGFIGSKIIYDYAIGPKPKKQKAVKTKKDKSFINEQPVNTPYEFKGSWYYYDENNNYYIVDETNNWISCNNPHIKVKKVKKYLYFDAHQVNTPYELDGKWYYYDDQGQYYTIGNDNNWIRCENPNIK